MTCTNPQCGRTFKTDNCDVVLHEHRSGYAGTHMAVWGLDEKCHQWGVQRVYGVAVTGYDLDSTGSVTAVETDQGPISCEQVVVGAGPWTRPCTTTTGR